MYCGDETGSFIGDVGSRVSRFGYGGEDCPKYVTPSFVAEEEDEAGKYHVLSSCYNSRWANSNVTTPLRNAYTSSNSNNDAVASTAAPIVDPTFYLQQGDSYQDWDAVEQLWQTAFDTMYVRDTRKHTKGGGSYTSSTENTTKAPSGVTSTTIIPSTKEQGKCIHPLLAVAPGCTYRVGTGHNNNTGGGQSCSADAHRKELVQLTELMMEKLECKALFIAPAPMLAAFSQGRQTALVVDIGASGTRATPVVDGIVMKQAQRRSGRGGEYLENVLWKALAEEKTVLRPRYQLAAGGKVAAKQKPCASGIFHRWAMNDLMYEFCTSEHVQLAHWWYDPTVPFIYNDSPEQDNSSIKMDVDPPAESTYELPDGTLVDLTTRTGKDLCRIPELFFTEELPFLPNGVDSSILGQHPSLSNLPLPKLIQSSLSAVGDVDARKDLAGSILLTGGSSLYGNLEQRLSLEVSRIVSGAYKCKVLASRHSVERSYAPWIGGSILTSLGSFQQLWLSRAEYEEYGATLAVQRFP